MRSLCCLAIVSWLAGCGGSRPPPSDMPLPPLDNERVADPKAAPIGDMTLRVMDVQPATGSAAGTEALTIRGANFRTATGIKVMVGRVEATVLHTTDDQIVVQTPPGTAGQVADVVVIFDPGGEITLRGVYTYVAAPKAP